jgi:hypothetical protein
LISEVRTYQAIVWQSGADRRAGERVTILAIDLKDAERQIKDRYGDEVIFSLYNEDDAAKPRWLF